ncbi:hypothetical protein AAHA92_33368 [Salvia divinorum]|uniref:Uncharacterized protein n=1 Tax=Salvia divinorum TaxID=28513 RepID=A0ABD1FNR9_SALDI
MPINGQACNSADRTPEPNDTTYTSDVGDGLTVDFVIGPIKLAILDGGFIAPITTLLAIALLRRLFCPHFAFLQIILLNMSSSGHGREQRWV